VREARQQTTASNGPWSANARAIAAGSFADIFRQNALKNGLLPVVLPEAAYIDLLDRVQRQPGLVVSIDLVRQVAGLPGGGEAAFTIDAFARECLMAGVDEIGYVLAQDEAIARFESSRSSSRW